MHYTDIHTHILPGVDDGPEEITESLRMLDIAYQEGIRRIIATPHFGLKNPGLSQEYAKKQLEKLQKAAARDMPDLVIDYGNELYWSDGIIESLKDGTACTLAKSEFVLVEFGIDTSYEDIEDAVIRLKWNGYRPILAHTERYEHLKRKPDRVRQIKQRGGMIQVNCRSLVLDEGKKKGLRMLFSRRDDRLNWSERLMKDGLIDFIASDCHDIRIRKPEYRNAAEKIRQQCEESEVLRIITKNTNLF